MVTMKDKTQDPIVFIGASCFIVPEIVTGEGRVTVMLL
jgi:hypothetical protein